MQLTEPNPQRIPDFIPLVFLRECAVFLTMPPHSIAPMFERRELHAYASGEFKPWAARTLACRHCGAYPRVLTPAAVRRRELARRDSQFAELTLTHLFSCPRCRGTRFASQRLGCEVPQYHCRRDGCDWIGPAEQAFTVPRKGGVE